MRWRIVEEHPSSIVKLAKGANLHYRIAQILVNRGVSSEEGVGEILNPPRVEDAPLPVGAREAAKIILESISAGEEVFIFGDYDVDGLTASAIFKRAFALLSVPAKVYIPNRLTEGYGLSADVVEKIAKPGVLILTVDTGTTAVEEVEEAKRRGAKIVVTDHHEAIDGTSNPHVLVNPKVRGPAELSSLSGSAVAFFVLKALAELLGNRDILEGALALACFGSIADVVPPTGYSRSVMVEGLKEIKEKKPVWVRALCKVSGVSVENVTPRVLSSVFGPLVNSAGRMGDASFVVKLFTSPSEKEALPIAERLKELNVKRQVEVSRIMDEAMSLVNPDDPAIVVWGPWHPGVLGIVAARLCESFYRPAFVISTEVDPPRGSVRTVEGMEISRFVPAVRDLFINFGGHELAGGFVLPRDNLEKLRHALRKALEGAVSQPAMVDAVLRMEEIDEKFIGDLERLSPFGEGFESPRFLIMGANVVGIKGLGRGGRHLKITVEQDGKRFEAIAFGLSEKLESLRSGMWAVVEISKKEGPYGGVELIVREIFDKPIKVAKNLEWIDENTLYAYGVLGEKEFIDMVAEESLNGGCELVFYRLWDILDYAWGLSALKRGRIKISWEKPSEDPTIGRSFLIAPEGQSNMGPYGRTVKLIKVDGAKPVFDGCQTLPGGNLIAFQRRAPGRDLKPMPRIWTFARISPKRKFIVASPLRVRPEGMMRGEYLVETRISLESFVEAFQMLERMFWAPLHGRIHVLGPAGRFLIELLRKLGELRSNRAFLRGQWAREYEEERRKMETWIPYIHPFSLEGKK